MRTHNYFPSVGRAIKSITELLTLLFPITVATTPSTFSTTDSKIKKVTDSYSVCISFFLYYKNRFFFILFSSMLIPGSDCLVHLTLNCRKSNLSLFSAVIHADDSSSMGHSPPPFYPPRLLIRNLFVSSPSNITERKREDVEENSLNAKNPFKNKFLVIYYPSVSLKLSFLLKLSHQIPRDYNKPLQQNTDTWHHTRYIHTLWYP